MIAAEWRCAGSGFTSIDIVDELARIIGDFNASESLRTCVNGHLLEVPRPFVLEHDADPD